METNENDAPNVENMISDSVSSVPRSREENALDDLQIQISGGYDDDDDTPPHKPIDIVFSGPVQGEPERRRGRPKGTGTRATTVRKKAEIVTENEQLKARIAELSSTDDPQSRQNIATMAQLLAITLYGVLAELRDMPHYALKEEEAKEFGTALSTSMPAQHIAAIDSKVPYLMPAIALTAPLVRGVIMEVKLRRMMRNAPSNNGSTGTT